MCTWKSFRSETNPNVLSFTVWRACVVENHKARTAAELRVTLADQTCKACHAAILTGESHGAIALQRASWLREDLAAHCWSSERDEVHLSSSPDRV